MLNSASAHADDLASFVVDSPTALHAAAQLAERLRAAGFVQIDPSRPFGDVTGRRFIARDGAVVAWVAPEKVADDIAFRIVGTHTDSPTFKLKPGSLASVPGWGQVGVEIYGGPLLNSWLDRDLGIAGRIVTLDGVSHLVKTGPVARIAQLAVHLDRSVGDGLRLDRQVHTQPIVGMELNRPVLDYVGDTAGLDPADIVLHDLFLFDTQAPARIGVRGELFASGRLDNLSSTHAAVTAIESAQPGSDIAVFVAFDHEEVGSQTSTGAAGPVLQDVLERIAAGYAMTLDETRAMLARSVCLSADTGHLVHPNYPGHHDPVNRPVPNRGPLLKLNASQRYATDAAGSAYWLRACRAAGVPTQAFVSNNAVPCGSTIGPITATRLGITTVDVGVGVLSMHSARELCGVEDPWLLARAVEAFLEGA